MEKELIKLKAQMKEYIEHTTDTINVLTAQYENILSEVEKKDAMIEGLNASLRRYWALEKIDKKT